MVSFFSLLQKRPTTKRLNATRFDKNDRKSDNELPLCKRPVARNGKVFPPSQCDLDFFCFILAVVPRSAISVNKSLWVYRAAAMLAFNTINVCLT